MYQRKVSEFSKFLLSEGFKLSSWSHPRDAWARFEWYSRALKKGEVSTDLELLGSCRLEVTASPQLNYEPGSCEIALVFGLPTGFFARTAVALYDPQLLPGLLTPAIESLYAGAVAMVREPLHFLQSGAPSTLREFSKFLLGEGFRAYWQPDRTDASARFETYLRPFTKVEPPGDSELLGYHQLEVAARTRMEYEPHSCELAMLFRLPTGFSGKTVLVLNDPQLLPELLTPAIEPLKAGALAIARAGTAASWTALHRYK